MCFQSYSGVLSVWFDLLFKKTVMAGIVAKKKKSPAVLKHYEVPETLPDGDFKAKCKYCDKEITGSTKTTTNWWKHLVRNNRELILYLV